MTPIVLFDWGDTLMRDIPWYGGRMCDWPEVAAMPGAEEALASLSRRSRLGVASGASDSSAADIRRALARVDLERYIAACFCPDNVGYHKPDPRFYQAVLDRLGVGAGEVTMVGDSLEKDILPCRRLGMRTVLVAAVEPPSLPAGVLWLRGLPEIIDLVDWQG